MAPPARTRRIYRHAGQCLSRDWRRGRGGPGRHRLCRCRNLGRLSRGHAAPVRRRAERHRWRGGAAPIRSEATLMPKFSADEIRKTVVELGPWFHNIDLGGIQTAPDHFLGDYPAVKWRRFAHAIPADLSGQSVLDIGCIGGFYALEMKRGAAARVVAIDSDEG